MPANYLIEYKDRYVAAVPQPQMRFGIDVDFLEIDAERTQLARHLFAEMAAAAAVQPNLYRLARRS